MRSWWYLCKKVKSSYLVLLCRRSGTRIRSEVVRPWKVL